MTDDYIITTEQFKKVLLELSNITENHHQKNEIYKVLWSVVIHKVEEKVDESKS